jgi:hypothetical protein
MSEAWVTGPVIMPRGVFDMTQFFKYLILTTLLILLVSSVSAAMVYQTGVLGVTGKGADGVQVPLGIPVTSLYLYTWISLGFLFLIAAGASQRNGEFWAILLPMFAAMFWWFGWLVMPTEQGIGIIIMAGVLAMGVYFKGKQQEKFGIAGPGSPFLNIVFWMIILQASIGFINEVGLFHGHAIAATPLTYQNADLSTTVPATLKTGGFFEGLVDTVYIMTGGVVAAIIMISKILINIVYFKGLVLSIAPFLAGSAAVNLFLNVMTVAIDFIVAIAMWMWIFKPPLGESV